MLIFVSYLRREKVKNGKSRIQNNIIITKKVTKHNDSIKINSNERGNCLNNANNILTTREGSSNINLDKSLIYGCSSNLTLKVEKDHLNGNNRFIIDNKKAREKYKQKLNCAKKNCYYNKK